MHSSMSSWTFKDSQTLWLSLGISMSTVGHLVISFSRFPYLSLPFSSSSSLSALSGLGDRAASGVSEASGGPRLSHGT